MDYRDDDQRGEGYCPLCKRRLSDLTTEARGFCELHGWQFAEFTRPKEKEEEDE